MNMRTDFLVLAGACALLVAGGCGSTDDTNTTNGGGSGAGGKDTGCILGGSGGSRIECGAVIEVRDSAGLTKPDKSTVSVAVGNIKTNETLDIKLTISNAASLQSAGLLKISGVRMEYEPKASAESAGNAFQCFGPDGTTPCDKMAGKWRPVAPVGANNAGWVSQEEIIVRFKRYDDQARDANLWLTLQGDKSYYFKDFLIRLNTKSGSPKIKLPAAVEFGQVAPESTSSQDFVVTNTGDAVLEIRKIDFVADPVFSLETKLNDGSTKVFKPGEPIVFNPPLAIDQSSTYPMKIHFAPKDPNKKQGMLTFGTNDPKPDKNGEVPLLANSKVPCMQLEPASKVNFSGVKLGEPATREVKIKACGGADLIVHKIEFGDAGNSSEFAFLFAKTKAKYPDINAETGPSKEAPIVVKVNEEAVFEVIYTPADESPKDPSTNQVLVDTAEVKVLSNAFQAKNTVICEGSGVLTTCPTAVVKVAEGEEVIPQTVLHLFGDKSQGSGGAAIKKYKWTVKQPGGSTQVFVPGSNFPNPTFAANAAGEYEFCLEVWDANDQPSCAPACVTVMVIPEEAIHVELLWHTPADPDEADTGPAAGADLDLHFAHYIATGPDQDCDAKADPWFSNPFDTFWFNPNPPWGSSDKQVPDDPSLDLDDTDGSGPENLNLSAPEGTLAKPAFYHVGVHYWNDHGYGMSEATVNIYIFGMLVLQVDKVAMNVLDMWYVGKIHWPNTITDKAAANVEPVEICYQTGDPCKGGKRWVPQGDYCISKCYIPANFTTTGAASSANCKKTP